MTIFAYSSKLCILFWTECQVKLWNSSHIFKYCNSLALVCQTSPASTMFDFIVTDTTYGSENSLSFLCLLSINQLLHLPQAFFPTLSFYFTNLTSLFYWATFSTWLRGYIQTWGYNFTWKHKTELNYVSTYIQTSGSDDGKKLAHWQNIMSHNEGHMAPPNWPNTRNSWRGSTQNFDWKPWS